MLSSSSSSSPGLGTTHTLLGVALGGGVKRIARWAAANEIGRECWGRAREWDGMDGLGADRAQANSPPTIHPTRSVGSFCRFVTADEVRWRGWKGQAGERWHKRALLEARSRYGERVRECSNGPRAEPVRRAWPDRASIARMNE
ncbi:hypothetical protein VFPFJ_02481 [Purpureocillium lilacinum]|uniref:Uncharacterized protein n=1 Tax=Purpureocillium lilacinum TaxID=33203 RepID=A0A179HVA4_PURLI|nr:hypothetical protein VFPFJ_02481 [Purpureocillium lilacinum]OAQ93320.1 hypothetical protein VFPFJ_02481 [Purpureocillium lilacinum]